MPYLEPRGNMCKFLTFLGYARVIIDYASIKLPDRITLVNAQQDGISLVRCGMSVLRPTCARLGTVD